MEYEYSSNLPGRDRTIFGYLPNITTFKMILVYDKAVRAQVMEIFFLTMTDAMATDIHAFKYSERAAECDNGHTVEVYKQWAKEGRYDRESTSTGYEGPTIMADELDKLFPKNRDQLRIVDIGAGTGLAAIELRRRGYTRMDSVEPMREMTKYASERNLYENYMCEFLSDKPLDIAEGTYDVAVCVGLISGNHFPPAAMKELLRIIKPGGYIIKVGLQYQYYRLPEFHRDLAQEMYRLETENKMRIIKKELKEGYLQFHKSPLMKDAMVFVIKKL